MYSYRYDILHVHDEKNVMIVMNISIFTLSLYRTLFQELSRLYQTNIIVYVPRDNQKLSADSRFRFFVVCDVINIVFFVKFLLFFSLYYAMQFLRDVTSNRLISTSVLILTNIYSICLKFYIHVFVFFLSHIFHIILSILCLFLLELYTTRLYRNVSKQLQIYCHSWIPKKNHFWGGGGGPTVICVCSGGF